MMDDELELDFVTIYRYRTDLPIGDSMHDAILRTSQCPLGLDITGYNWF